MKNLDFERLFGDHAQALYGFLIYRVGDPMVAEDLLGDTFERVVRSGARFDPRKGSEQAWIYAIALNCLRDHLRRAGGESRALGRLRSDATRMEEDVHEQVQRRDMLLGGLKELDDGEREVFALRYGAGLKAQEIASVIDQPLTTVNGRLYRGLRKLRRVLEAQPSEANPPSR